VHILLVATANIVAAEEFVRRLYPQATIEIIGKASLVEPSPWRSLWRLRGSRPDVFAVSWETLTWPVQQGLYACYGTLLGAREIIFFDSRGQMRRQTRWQVWQHELPWATLELLAALALVGVTAVAVLWWSLRPRRPVRPGARDAPILFLRTTPAPAALAGGAATHIRGFLTALVRHQSCLHVFSNDFVPELPATIPQTTIPPSPRFGLSRALSDVWNAWRFASRALVPAQQLQPQCIYQRYSRFNFSGVRLARCLRVPFLLEYNGSEVWVGRYWDRIGLLWLLERIERLNLRAADRIFTVSEVLARELVERGVPAEKIVVNPNGVDPEEFHPDCGGREVRVEQGWEDDVVVGFLGSFGPWHGAEVLAEAISQLPPSARLRFVLIGAGNLLPAVQRRVRATPWRERTLFLGRVAHAEVPRWLDACDILVSPHVPMPGGQEFFGSPTKLFEYMAVGKAIVASRLGQIAQVLEHERTALLVEPGNVAALTAAIARLAREPELRTRLGQQARQAVVEKYTWKQNAGRVLAAYHSRFGLTELPANTTSPQPLARTPPAGKPARWPPNAK